MTLRVPISPARWASTGAPEIINGLYKTSESIVIGTVLTLDANGELIVAISDTNNPANAGIAGIALQQAGSAPGYSIGQVDFGGTTVYTGRKQAVSYAVANDVTVFQGQISADGAAVTTPTQTLIGESYKLTKATNGIWYVDSADQTPANVTIVGIDDSADLLLVFFKITPAAQQI